MRINLEKRENISKQKNFLKLNSENIFEGDLVPKAIMHLIVNRVNYLIFF